MPTLTDMSYVHLPGDSAQLTRSAPPQQIPPPQPRRRPLSPWVIGALVLGVIVATTGVLSTIDDPVNDDPPTRPAGQSANLAALTGAVEDALGSSNRDVDRVTAVRAWPAADDRAVIVEWSLNRGSDSASVRRRAQLDVTDIIAAVKDTARWQWVELRLIGAYRLVDQFGAGSETEVISLAYSREAVARIQPESVPLDGLFDLAESSTLHPDLLAS